MTTTDIFPDSVACESDMLIQPNRWVRTGHGTQAKNCDIVTKQPTLALLGVILPKGHLYKTPRVIRDTRHCAYAMRNGCECTGSAYSNGSMSGNNSSIIWPQHRIICINDGNNNNNNKCICVIIEEVATAHGRAGSSSDFMEVVKCTVGSLV